MSEERKRNYLPYRSSEPWNGQTASGQQKIRKEDFFQRGERGETNTGTWFIPSEIRKHEMQLRKAIIDNYRKSQADVRTTNERVENPLDRHVPVNLPHQTERRSCCMLRQRSGNSSIGYVRSAFNPEPPGYDTIALGPSTWSGILGHNPDGDIGRSRYTGLTARNPSVYTASAPTLSDNSIAVPMMSNLTPYGLILPTTDRFPECPPSNNAISGPSMYTGLDFQLAGPNPFDLSNSIALPERGSSENYLLGASASNGFPDFSSSPFDMGNLQKSLFNEKTPIAPPPGFPPLDQASRQNAINSFAGIGKR